MENQKYRDRAGQLFVDNFGRLNMTVQTGSMLGSGTWEAGPTGFFNEGPGNSAATGTPNGIIQSSPWGYQRFSGSAIYDGISWNKISDVTAVGGSFNYANCSIGTVDGMLCFSDTQEVLQQVLTQVSTDLFQMLELIRLFKKIGMVLVGTEVLIVLVLM